ncbi:MAG: oligosaccharide flippase family protein [Bacteroidota bacterium]|nr:MAG: oligosaccharide flippase family protein [Bacteroidota bacterium]
MNNNTSSKSKNILLLVLSQAINLIILFLFTPYLVRALPQEQFGTYSQVLLIAEFIGVLVSLAVVQIAMMVFTKPDVPFSDAFKTVFRFNLISSLLGVVFMWLFSTFASSVFRNESLTFLLILFSPYVLGLKMNAVFNQALIRLNESKFILYVTVSMNLLKLTLAFVAVHYYHSLPAMMVVYALDPVLQSTIQYIKIYLLGHTKGHFSMKLLRISFPLHCHYILWSYLGLPMHTFPGLLSVSILMRMRMPFIKMAVLKFR